MKKNNNFNVDDAFQILHPQDERWLDYIIHHPQSSIFHHPAWITLISECYGYHPFILAINKNDGGISAGLPIMKIRSMVTGKRWVSLPFTDYCAPLYDDHESLSKLTSKLVMLCEENDVPRIEVRGELAPHAAIQSNVSYYLHTVKLDSDPQLVLNGFKRTHRQNIGTAEKRGVRIEYGTAPEHLHRFYIMQLETRRRKGIPVQPWSFFDLLLKKILAQGLGFILLAYKDTQCLAGGVFLHWQQTLTYKYAASCGEDQQYRSNNLLSWTAMNWGCDNGYMVFDLGRTGIENEGLRRFKNGWGAEEQSLPYSLLSDTIPENGDGKLISLMSPVIQKAPTWVCRMTGELLYRHFG